MEMVRGFRWEVGRGDGTQREEHSKVRQGPAGRPSSNRQGAEAAKRDLVESAGGRGGRRAGRVTEMGACLAYTLE